MFGKRAEGKKRKIMFGKRSLSSNDLLDEQPYDNENLLDDEDPLQAIKRKTFMFGKRLAVDADDVKRKFMFGKRQPDMYDMYKRFNNPYKPRRVGGTIMLGR